jgi:hypothetical protein
VAWIEERSFTLFSGIPPILSKHTEAVRVAFNSGRNQNEPLDGFVRSRSQDKINMQLNLAYSDFNNHGYSRDFELKAFTEAGLIIYVCATLIFNG